MDFFRSQDHARRNTRLLLVLFTLAVITLVGLTNLLAYFALGMNNHQAVYGAYLGVRNGGGYVYDWRAFLLISGGVLLFISAGSAYRVMSLSGGGDSVATMMNGELVSDPGGSIEKRRLLNVVEEMAIASGTPVPSVYIIPDESINAFAAGHSPGDAVIAVTRGTVDSLNRDQLQGVVAHEFSHILNGDMRLNIRLIGILYGILMLAVIGRILLESGRGSRYSSRRSNGGPIILLGIGLFVLGYVGKFFGQLIKAAVSRQREFLADASAVQFTRNPEGIGGALKRIGGYMAGSILGASKSEEISHAFFAQGVKVSFTSLLATHPPLDERIKRIEPRWNGRYIFETMSSPPEAAPAEAAPKPGMKTTAMTAMAVAAAATTQIDADKVMANVGNPGGAHIEHARNVIAAIPDELAEAAREPYSARAVIYLVLLDKDQLIRSRQVDHLSGSADAAVFDRFKELLTHADDITPQMRLPLVQLSLSALRQLSESQYTQFKGNVEALIREDNRVGLSEWALHRVVTKHLGEAHEGKRSAPKSNSLDELKEDIGRLLSMLAYADRSSGTSPEKAFEIGKEAVGLDITLLAKHDLTLSSLNASLDALANLRPLRKPKLLKACIATITADGVVAPVESELVRAIADTLDCPMPPIVV